MLSFNCALIHQILWQMEHNIEKGARRGGGGGAGGEVFATFTAIRRSVPIRGVHRIGLDVSNPAIG